MVRTRSSRRVFEVTETESFEEGKVEGGSTGNRRLVQVETLQVYSQEAQKIQSLRLRMERALA